MHTLLLTVSLLILTCYTNIEGYVRASNNWPDSEGYDDIIAKFELKLIDART